MSIVRWARIVASLSMLWMLSACEKPVPPTEAVGPRTEGDSLVFPAGAAGLDSIRSLAIEMQPTPPTGLNGRVTWNEDKTVRVFTPFGGRVQRILAQPGQNVAAGQILAMIASPEFGQAQADAGRADADFALAEKNLARVRELEQNGVVARKELQAAEADHARARSELTRAKRRLALYGDAGRGIDQSYALVSPIAGVVIERNINPGQELRADQAGAGVPALFVVTDPSSLWVQLDAAEKDLPLMTRGKTIAIRTPAYPGTAFSATIETVADYLDTTTHTIKVRALIENKDRVLKSEMLVVGLVDFGGATELLVPARSMFFQNEKHYVFVDEGGGRFTRREVKVGDIRDSRIEILEGLQSGEKVVVEGALMLQQVLKPRRVQK